MGGEASSLKDYQIGQPNVVGDDHTIKYNVCSATHQGNKFTVFQYGKENGVLPEYFEKHLELVRTTRHPYILKYVTSFNDSKMKCLISEHVTPLDVAVEKQEIDEVFTGLYNVLEALIFLHDRSLVCHNNLTVSSVYVNDMGIWKLAAFENSTKVLRLSKQSYEKDIRGYAEFALSVLEYLKDDSEKTKIFMDKLENEYLDETGTSNVSLKDLLEDQFFRFVFLEILEDIKNIPLKDSSEKQDFFSHLPEKLSSLHPQVISRRLIKPLFAQLMITEPEAEVFHPHLFASGNDYCQEHDISSIYDEEYFRQYSLPLILELFSSKDVSVRLVLLKYLPLYVDQIQRVILKEQILPEIIVGLKDSNESIVSETFRSLALLVPILGAEDVVGGTCATIFIDRKPDFSRSPKGYTQGRSSKIDQEKPSVRETMKHSKPSNSDKNKENERKRQEREKQREEQRRKREERKKEREQARARRVSRQSSSDEGRNIVPPDTAAVISSEPENQPEEVPVKSNSYTSEADWEGFEANSSDSEQKDAANSKHYSPRISHIEDYSFSKDDFEDINVETSESFPIEHTGDSWGWSDQTPVDLLSENLLGHKSISPTFSKEESNIINTSPKTTKSSKSLSLANTKKIITTDSKESKKNNDLKSSESKISKPKDLGNEFDIKISSMKLQEPDYFADMLPSVEKQSTVLIETKGSHFSSKFNALDVQSEEADGWGDDVDGGWDDQDF